MKPFSILLLGAFFLTTTAWADPTNPPAPPTLPEGLDTMPLPAEQSTPLILPGGSPSDASLASPPTAALKALDQAQPASTPGKSASSQDSLDTGMARSVPTPTVAAPKPSPSPVGVAPLKNMTLSTGDQHAVADNGNQGGGTLADYFPASEGMKWSYQYLGAGEGESSPKTREVVCSSQKQMPNGTQRLVLDVSEGRTQFRERYSLYENKVEHTATADKQFKGNFAFKLPAAGESLQWSAPAPGGAVQNFKASFGTGKAGEKTYPDCLVVVEKSTKAKKTGPIVISYYAKGVGLVAVETYSPDMKLIPERSFALSSPPGENGK